MKNEKQIDKVDSENDTNLTNLLQKENYFMKQHKKVLILETKIVKEIEMLL